MLGATSPQSHFIRPSACLLLALGLMSCAGMKEKAAPEDKKDLTEQAATEQPAMTEPVGGSVDLSFLLSMNFEEAKAISAQSLELPNGVRIAADNIEVLKLDSDQQPKRLRAKGRVYLETGGGQDLAKVLCQEVYISSWEIVLRGKPIVQRGSSTIEGLNDDTVAYMLGTRLRVIGLHRVTNQNAMLAMLPDLGPWTAGPNPLLPALTEESVPNDIRDQMLRAAEAEAVLQQNRADALTLPEAPPAPWVKPESKPADASKKPEVKETPPSAPQEKPKAASKSERKAA